jgi:hypothetical protein
VAARERGRVWREDHGVVLPPFLDEVRQRESSKWTGTAGEISRRSPLCERKITRRMPKAAPRAQYDKYVRRGNGLVSTKKLMAGGKRLRVDAVQSGTGSLGLVVPAVNQLERVIFRFHGAIRTGQLFAVRKFWPRHDPKWVAVRRFDCRRLNIAVSEFVTTIWTNQQPFRHLTPRAAYNPLDV